MSAQAPYPDLPSVEDIARDLPAIVDRFARGETHAFAFGDNGVPEAVIASYDQFDDLAGEDTLGHYPTVLAPDAVARQLPEMVEAIRRGTFGSPVLGGTGPTPSVVVMSTQQYRAMRGDDEPPEGVLDDPTVRVYDSKPTPGSKPFSLDEWAKDDAFAQQMLAEMRAERDENDA